MNPRHLIGIAQTFQAAHQILQRVAVLGKDQPLLPGVARLFEHLAQLLELRFLARRAQRAGAVAQPPEGLDFLLQLLGGNRRHRAEHRVLVILAALARCVVARVLVRAVGVVEVVSIAPLQLALAAAQVAGAQAAERRSLAVCCSFSMRRSNERSSAQVELASRR